MRRIKLEEIKKLKSNQLLYCCVGDSRYPIKFIKFENDKILVFDYDFMIEDYLYVISAFDDLYIFLVPENEIEESEIILDILRLSGWLKLRFMNVGEKLKKDQLVYYVEINYENIEKCRVPMKFIEKLVDCHLFYDYEYASEYVVTDDQCNKRIIVMENEQEETDILFSVLNYF